ncbi:MAG: hypothetical protein ACSHXY_01780 [Alphaproteobacteria bacterium]
MTLRQLIARHRKDESGSLSLPFAVSLLTLVTAVGATFDINQVQASSTRSQQIADMIGLTATVYIKNHGTPPTQDSDGFVDGKTYSAKTMGYDIGPATKGTNDVTFKVNYDDNYKRATVSMNGAVNTSFMAMFGKTSLPFDTTSVVVYAQSDLKDPASVILVMDNSGSMAWDDKPSASNYNPSRPSGAQARIDGLKTTVKNFNDYLGQAVGVNAGGTGTNYLRMGMTAYSSGLITSRTVLPKWGTLSNGNINSLHASGGTDSRQSMALAYSWMLAEDPQHLLVNGSTDPLKYVIFMTDGVNTQDYVCTWERNNNTNYWRRSSYYYWSGYEYKSSYYKPYGYGWEEGRETCEYIPTANNETLATCTQLKNLGVEVYTIGYALEPGKYATNPPSSHSWTTQDSDSTDTAYDFLESCASSDDHFVKAENTDALEAAFDKIGEDIIADVVRVSM